MKRRLATIGLLLALAGGAVLSLAQTETEEEMEPLLDIREEETLPGEAELRASIGSPLQLGADQGNACVCLCQAVADPEQQRWSYFERSIVSGCQWSGRICVVGGGLGKIGACTSAPAPLERGAR